MTTILNDKSRLHHVPLPDGRMVRHVRLSELRKLFREWRIPGITENMVKDDLAASYFAHLGTVAKDVEANAAPMRDKVPGRSLRDGTGAMSPTLMRMAADVIAGRVAAIETAPKLERAKPADVLPTSRERTESGAMRVGGTHHVDVVTRQT